MKTRQNTNTTPNYDEDGSLEVLEVKPPAQQNLIDFHPNLPDINTGACVLDCAPTKSGKTTRISNLLLNPNFYAGKFDMVYFYSSTLYAGDITGRFLLDQFEETIYNEYSDKHLKSILDHQLSVPTSERPRIAIIFDDFLSFPNLTPKSLLFRISASYRHHGVKLLYYSSQLFRAVPPIVRQNIQYCILGKNANSREVMKMYEEIGMRYGNYKQFVNLLQNGTEGKYNCLYLDLMGSPPRAFKNFNKLIYTAPENVMETLSGGGCAKSPYVDDEGS
jgi:hypothetical protein